MQSLTTSLQNSRALVVSTDERVRMLQRKLYLKAKQDKTFKFYVLYDKVRLEYFLEEAYYRVKANGGAPGIDGVTFAMIEEEGVIPFLKKIRDELATKTYKAQAVKRVYIPKANGKQRPLGIPTIRDRVVQMSCEMVIEPIFEADFADCSFGFRPKRSAKDAMKKIKSHLQEKRVEVFDADLEAYFDTIPHDKLMIAVQERIADGNVPKLTEQWLKSSIVEDGKYKGGKSNKIGTPQGGVVSPLLANIYLNLLDRIIQNPKSEFAQAVVRIVRYCDDYVLQGGTISEKVIAKLEQILGRMGLRLNKEKSKRVNLRQETMDFLGFTVRYARTPYKGFRNKFWNILPSNKSEKRMRQTIKTVMKISHHTKPAVYVKQLNSKLRGWVNYYKIAGVSQMYARHYRQYAYKKFIHEHGLINLYQCLDAKVL